MDMVLSHMSMRGLTSAVSSKPSGNLVLRRVSITGGSVMLGWTRSVLQDIIPMTLFPDRSRSLTRKVSN